MSTDYAVVIPARHGSSRLPGKPLADIGGKPMVVRVAEQVSKCSAADIVIATDHDAIRTAAMAHGFRAEMTSATHRSGSDRVWEVAQRLAWHADRIIVNVQGDEPMVPPSVIDQVASLLADSSIAGVATLCEPLTERRLLFDTNVVKVVRRDDGRALYFSRAPVPWWRDGFNDDAGTENTSLGAGWLRHVGIYAYRLQTLHAFCEAGPGLLESHESLEQLRLLEMGAEILIADAVESVPGGVDTANDLARVRKYFEALSDSN